MNIIEEKPVPLVEVVETLKRKDAEYTGRGAELLYEQKRALENVSKFSVVGRKDAKEMAGKLQEAGPLLGQERIVKIIDLMPKSVDDIRAIFAKERFRYTEEEIKKIIGVVDQYR